MPSPLELLTPRLRMRQWRDEDREPFAQLNADPEVMRYFPSLQDRALSDRSIDIWSADLAERGWGNWAVEWRSGGGFIGFVGLSVPRRALPFMPCVEVGYRLAKAHWGQGVATEAGQAALRLGFTALALPEIVSFTAKLNLPSQRVMQKLGMIDSHEDFEHPAVPEGHPLRPHCLYRLSRSHWERHESQKHHLPVV